MATHPLTLVQVIRQAQDAALEGVRASKTVTNRGNGSFIGDRPEDTWQRFLTLYNSGYNAAHGRMGTYARLGWVEGTLLARMDDRLWGLMELPPSHIARATEWSDFLFRVPNMLAILARRDPSAYRAILTTARDDWLVNIRDPDRGPLASSQDVNKEFTLGFIDAELVRRAESRERRLYAQTNMAGALENGYIPAARPSIPAAIQQLIGSFLHNIGTAPLGHPTRLPIVPPRPVARAEAVGAKRKAASEAASSNQRSKHDDVD